jgi:Alpha/beta hydrolase domain
MFIALRLQLGCRQLMCAVLANAITAVIAVGPAVVISPPARAEPSDLTVRTAKDIGPFRGKAYREVEAQMQGNAPGGAYAVPVTLTFPKQLSDHNGFAIVDIVNTVTIGKEQFVLGGQPLPLARVHMGDAFLFGWGNVYVGVIWDKTAVEALGKGTIATAVDGYTILRDAATVARNPSKYLSAEAGTAPASDNIIAYGYSQTANLLRGWYFDHLNRETGTPAFDGGLVAGANGRCHDLHDLTFKTCAGALADGGKVIDLSPETDVEWGGDAERGVNPDYRVIEIAGVSHIPPLWADFRSHGMPEQNPVGFEPVFRAALVNLQEWLKGRDPPPSVAIDLSDAPPRNLECCGPVREAARDAEGNAKGGVRLPHMTSMLPDGRKAGAPLGQYTGFAFDYVKSNFFFTLSGTFRPFSPEKIRELYPTHAAYVDAVTTSTEDLVTKRYILPEAAEAYIEAAKRSDIGRP